MIKNMSMKKYLLSPLLGLFIVISGLGVTTSASAFTLHNYQTGYCLAVAGVPPKNQPAGVSIIVWACDGTPGQQWGYNSEGASLPAPPSNGSYLGYYLVSSVATSRNLSAVENHTDLGGDSLANGSRVIDSTTSGAIAQQWELSWERRDSAQHDCYVIVNRATPNFTKPFVLGVSGGSPNQGISVIIWQQFFTASGAPDFVNHPDQYWCVYADPGVPSDSSVN